MTEDRKPPEETPTSGESEGGGEQQGWYPAQGEYRQAPGQGQVPGQGQAGSPFAASGPAGWGGPPGWGPPGGYPYQQQGGWYGPPPKPKRKVHPLLIILLFFLVAIFIGVLLTMRSSGPATSGSISSFRLGKRVGVVRVEGIILDSRDIVKQIHRYRDDSSIKAVVIRVDSPGGGVGASQEIHGEVKKLAEDKPVVVSMGSMAASGGYYVSCPADVIYANPGTITGSIGVVMEFTNLEGLMEWMKIENWVIKSGEYKDIGSAFRDMKPDEKKLLEEFVQNVHHQFEEVVVEGRDMERAKVRKIADGRIYTGEQAKEAGLVDEMGNLWDAIDKAAELAEISGKPKVVWPPEKRPTFPFGMINEIIPGALDSKRVIPTPVRAMYILNVH